MTDLLAGLRLAVGTLTIVPVGRIEPITPPVARRAMLLAPIAVLPVAAVASIMAVLGELAGLPRLVTAVAVVAALAFGSRGMHLDGLADTVDGFAAGWDRERALAVMRRGDAGPMGVAALVIVLFAQLAAAGALIGRPGGWLVIGAAVLASRAACPILTRRGVLAARPDGLGAAVAGVVPTWAATLVAALASIPMIAALVLPGRVDREVMVPAGIVAVLAASGAVLALGHRATRTFGGVTGDILGAGIEIELTVLLVVLSAGW